MFLNAVYALYAHLFVLEFLKKINKFSQNYRFSDQNFVEWAFSRFWYFMLIQSFRTWLYSISSFACCSNFVCEWDGKNIVTSFSYSWKQYSQYINHVWRIKNSKVHQSYSKFNNLFFDIFDVWLNNPPFKLKLNTHGITSKYYQLQCPFRSQGNVDSMNEFD